MAPKFNFNESPKGTLNLTVEDGPKKTTWALTARSKTPTLLDVFKGVYEALGGLPEPVAYRPTPKAALSPAPAPAERMPSEWDDPGEDTDINYIEGRPDGQEPFPLEQLLALPTPPTEQDSLNALSAAAARIQKMSFWHDDPEALNPNLVNDLDSGQRPPELTGYTPSVRVEGRKLSQ